MPSD